MNFGDYVLITMKRHGGVNEFYTHKVIGVGESNGYVDVPVQEPAKETVHPKIVPVIRCVCCGVDERHILKYRKEDAKYSH